MFPRTMTDKNYYEILGISQTATFEEVKKAYRSLALTYHPDKAAISKEDAETLFKEINTAHETLIDPTKRKVYDKYLNQETISDSYWSPLCLCFWNTPQKKTEFNQHKNNEKLNGYRAPRFR
jgi:curved DNA-binding protein CbpA